MVEERKHSLAAGILQAFLKGNLSILLIIISLLAGAAALLAPSFAEGFGLPLAEALAAGTPALCSDIPAFREIGCEAVDYLDPRRATDWAARIAELPERGGEARTRAVGLHKHVAPEAWLAELDGFLSEIAANKH